MQSRSHPRVDCSIGPQVDVRLWQTNDHARAGVCHEVPTAHPLPPTTATATATVTVVEANDPVRADVGEGSAGGGLHGTGRVPRRVARDGVAHLPQQPDKLAPALSEGAAACETLCLPDVPAQFLHVAHGEDVVGGCRSDGLQQTAGGPAGRLGEKRRILPRVGVGGADKSPSLPWPWRRWAGI